MPLDHPRTWPAALSRFRANSSPRRHWSEPKLPPELVELIIDHLQDSPQNLKVCSLVARAWRTRCQGHLFRCVQVDIWSLPPAMLSIVKGRIIRRLKGISSEDRIVPFTQELHIDTTTQRVGNRVSMHFMYRILSSLPPFTNLDTLTMNIPWNFHWEQYESAKQLPAQELSSCLSSLIKRSPRLEALSLQNPLFSSLDDVLTMMGFYSPRLGSLGIGNLSTLSDEIRALSTEQVRLWMEKKLACREARQVALTTIYVGYLHARIRDEILMHPNFIDWDTIKSLNLYWEREISSSCPTLLHRCLHHNLKELILTLVCCTDILTINVKPDQLPNLTRLRVCSESVDMITAVLAPLIPASPFLSRIEVVLDWAIPGVRKIHKSHRNSPVTQRLDPILANWMEELWPFWRYRLSLGFKVPRRPNGRYTSGDEMLVYGNMQIEISERLDGNTWTENVSVGNRVLSYATSSAYL
ncbi:hypothetical protein D9757_014629 [Collybiopsis confluens]|uniref:F-box domain-containing protein n=1 Tax=Collybiopsis confluens TaxID=2823264 RepID=A0A8H5CGI0_9AGAR|nr:hypothetical protein D9757_014629 [Collybiopsis confluens]